MYNIGVWLVRGLERIVECVDVLRVWVRERERRGAAYRGKVEGSKGFLVLHGHICSMINLQQTQTNNKPQHIYKQANGRTRREQSWVRPF